jgi:dCTP diphosphatase
MSCERRCSAEARRAALPTLPSKQDEHDSCHARGVSDLIELRDRLRVFTEERDWGQFHDPKSLILALVGEVGELAELFQWLPADAAVDRAREERLHERAGEELADVLIYLVRLADVLDIDLADAALRKLHGSSARFPANDFHGRAPDRT